jgi:hypothetical protein
MSISGWHDLVANMDEAIDAQWSELVRLIPMRLSPYGEGNERDMSRPTIEVGGVLFIRGDQSAPLMGLHSGTPFIGREVVEDLSLSVTVGQLAGYDVRVGDIVLCLDPARKGARFEVNRIADTSTNRVKLILIEVTG